MFWRKKPIVLHCYTFRPDVFNYFPIVEAKQKVPEWFKKLTAPYYKSPEDHSLNLKLCPAASSLFSSGFILPLWSDLFLAVGEIGTNTYRWQYSDKTSDLESHPSEQWENNFVEEKYQHLKLKSPWIFECEEKIPFLALEPEWQFDVLDNITILNGVLEFHTQNTTNVNMFFRRREEEIQQIIPCGTPIYKFVPLSERKVILKNHLISFEEFNMKSSKTTGISFLRHFQKKKVLLKNKCPYIT